MNQNPFEDAALDEAADAGEAWSEGFDEDEAFAEGEGFDEDSFEDASGEAEGFDDDVDAFAEGFEDEEAAFDDDENAMEAWGLFGDYRVSPRAAKAGGGRPDA